MSMSKYRIKSVDELTFTDDGMFQAVMREPEICAEVVERLLHLKVSRIEYPELEKTIAPYFSSKGVRLDVYLKDPEKIIDVEMQSYPQIELGLRARYYQNMMDIDGLVKGQDYTELKPNYVLFICKKDPFRDEQGTPLGLPSYTFVTGCVEDKRANFNDKITKVVYNASGYEKAEDKKVRDFLRFVYTNDPRDDDFSNRLSERVRMLKDDDRFRREYAAMNLREMDIRREERQAALAEGMQIGLSKGLKQGLSQGLAEGIKQGEQETKINAAKAMLADGMDVNLIVKYTGLSVEKLKTESGKWKAEN
ncbi:MAG: Rpn family recombination-promoting nuclease/putative transposase [Treponema sp.]|nr:Rpn family recombination-promoting nuclease/putative transposase [Treponema sp.]